MGREGVSDEIGEVTNGKVLAEDIMAVTGGGDEFDTICIQEAVCWQVVGQVIDVDDKHYQAYDSALGDITYGLSHLG